MVENEMLLAFYLAVTFLYTILQDVTTGNRTKL